MILLAYDDHASTFYSDRPSKFRFESWCRNLHLLNLFSCILACTPWKFNIAPENKPSLKIGHPKRKVVFQPSFSRGYLTLKGCIIRAFSKDTPIRNYHFGSFWSAICLWNTSLTVRNQLQNTPSHEVTTETKQPSHQDSKHMFCYIVNYFLTWNNLNTQTWQDLLVYLSNRS